MATARGEITDLVHRCATALDTKDWDLLSTCFLADAAMRFPSGEERHGRPAIVAYMTASLAPLDASQHLIGNVVVAVEGERGSVVSYLHAQHVRHGAEGGSLFTVGGVYRDEVARGEEGWRIARRELTAVWTAGNSAVIRREGGLSGG